ncbi:MAG TPA: transketolase C-terminal domain-containing protein [Gemmatimonadaceae bacterium]|nr:transketolase C-terminal domain-containing protein [Gemmatimonadaceae bacterium]
MTATARSELNGALHLNPALFDDDVQQLAIRKGFGHGLVLAGDADPRVVVLSGDLTESAQAEAFKKKFPGRFVELGVAEQNMASVASGMAAMGKIPFITSYAMFSPGRNWEQVRTTICYNNRPVKIAGSHAGVSVGPDGGTHQAIEDIAITRVLPRMMVICPCDAIEARKATVAAVSTDTPVYLRLARNDTPVMTTDDTPFRIGEAQIVWQARGAKVGIIATGALLHKALLAARSLAEDGVAVEVMNLATVKPLDDAAVVGLAQRTGRIVTVEEHQIFGGMGSAVAECLVTHHPVPMRFVGVHDKFGQSGTPEELIDYYGMGRDAIIACVHAILGGAGAAGRG